MGKNIDLFTQSSIRIRGEKVVYVDPFQVSGAAHDADVILLTHDHYDHFSADDIAKVVKDDTTIVAPEKMAKEAKALVPQNGAFVKVAPNQSLTVKDIPIETVPSYNLNKSFHPKNAGWVGYVITTGGKRIYVAGDTDATPELKAVKCDIAMIPIGGTYTMTPQEAAAAINEMKPKKVIPTHYGSIVGKLSDGATFKALVDKDIKVDVRLQ